ncbi:MAG: hypothetical protein A3G75_00580 [Verrucomicrobia bacterium RIFCSPLOWO2_12_FULL_64_8]|nr:MAG: hypothetical protein A3G75_00580 [Verrucomicrobia bacterium RIFCSPLOWO2_12_FULL_64_8]
MDFFEVQERARKRTGRLVVLFGLAVLGTIAASYLAAILILRQAPGRAERVERGYWEYQGRAQPGPRYSRLDWWDPSIFSAVAGGVLLIVGCASTYKWLMFRQGGSVVAEMVGGRGLDPNTTNPAERRLLNIVEEMSIASGVPTPAVYVLEDEASINAFAAGLTTSDAVVAVTRGTMEKLNRDELQGVVAHEFSHILNGDMRMNVKLSAVLFGILVIGLIGRGILRGLSRGRIRIGGRGKGRGGAILVIVATGLAMMIIGYVGYLFGRLIQAAVSRQREFLADASAVQFTRNPDGIGGALRKIGGYALGSNLATSKASEIGHFFFAQGFRSYFGGLWATHPPLEERIRAVDPQWDGKYFEPKEVVDVKTESFRDAGFRGPRLSPEETVQRVFAAAAVAPVPAPRRTIALAPAALVAQVGSVTPRHVDYARSLLDATPLRLREAARVATEAPALIYGLLLDRREAVAEKQAELLATRGGETARVVRELLPHLENLPIEARLPLVQIALPALRQLPPPEVATLAATCKTLIEADQELSYFEYALQKVLLRHLAVAGRPAASAASITLFSAATADIAVLLSALAWAGAMQGPEQADGTVAADSRVAEAAFRAGAAQIKLIESRLSLLRPEACQLNQIDATLNRLAGASGAIKQRLLLACAHTVSADNQIRAEEGELLRAIADSLDCPMPPLLAEL